MDAAATRRLTRSAIAISVGGALALAGCGGDDEPAATGTDSRQGGITTTEPPKRETKVTGGETTLVLDPVIAELFATAGIALEPARGARQAGEGVSLPITAGVLDDGEFGGRLEHEGGLTFDAAGTELTAGELVLDADAGAITAELGGERVPLFSLDPSAAERSADQGDLVITGIEARLPQQGADRLNDALGIRLLEQGLEVGEVSVRAET